MPTTRQKLLSWSVMVAVLIYLGVHWSGKVLPQSVGIRSSGNSQAFLDFDCYWGAGLQVARGESVYLPIVEADACYPSVLPEYVYPPTLALALSLGEPLGTCRAEWAWFGLGILTCLALIPLLMGALALPRTVAMTALTGFMVLAPMATLENLTLGQVNLQILALLLGVVWALRKGRVALAGILLGLAFALKLFPVLYGPAFLRSRRAVLWLVLACLVLTTAVFLLAPADSPATFWHALRLKASGDLGSSTNASLVAWAVRAFQPGPQGIRALVMGNGLVVMGLAFLAWYWARPRYDDPWFSGVLLALIAALTPLYEVHHQVLLYPAFLVILADALARPGFKPKAAMLLGLTLVGILTNSRGLVPQANAHNMWSHLLVKPAGLALWALIVWMLVTLKVRRSEMGSWSRQD